VKKSGTILINPPYKSSKSKNITIKRLDKLAKESSEILYEISSVFPFQIFPDKVTIDTNKVTIVHKGLFFKNIFPILIGDIRTVKITRGLIFASLSFEVLGYEENPGTITHLWPETASKAEKIILGLLSTKREGLNISKIPKKELEKKVEKIGESTEKPEKLF
jgi:hypothetical protein